MIPGPGRGGSPDRGASSRQEMPKRGRNPFSHPVQGIFIAMGVVCVFVGFLILLTALVWLIAR
jgi:hypothetical protein